MKNAVAVVLCILSYRIRTVLPACVFVVSDFGTEPENWHTKEVYERYKMADGTCTGKLWKTIWKLRSVMSYVYLIFAVTYFLSLC